MSSGIYYNHSSVELFLLRSTPPEKNTIMVMIKNNFTMQVQRSSGRSGFFSFDFVIIFFYLFFLHMPGEQYRTSSSL